MADKSKIEWTHATWNPLTGCTKVSPGCVNCYAEKMAKRLAAMGQVAYQHVIDEHGRWNNKIHLIESALNKPLQWKKPRMIFVNSMSDLFHKDVDVLFIGRVLNVMASAHWHTFQVLTKRPERMAEVVNTYCDVMRGGKPLPNVWFMTSVENQKVADERILHLLKVNAVVRGLSCEPLLGMVKLSKYLHKNDGVNWVIVGGESGPQARPMHFDWVDSLLTECLKNEVAFFFKQWGEWSPGQGVFSSAPSSRFEVHLWDKHNISLRVGKKLAGCSLHGREWKSFPTDQVVNPSPFDVEVE